MSKSDAGKGFWADSERRKVVARIIDKTGIEPQRVFQAEGYSEELGRSIGHYVPGPEALASSLEEAAMQYQFNAYWADKPSSSDLLAALNSIGKAASRILKVLNIGPQADDVLAEIIRAIYALIYKGRRFSWVSALEDIRTILLLIGRWVAVHIQTGEENSSYATLSSASASSGTGLSKLQLAAKRDRDGATQKPIQGEWPRKGFSRTSARYGSTASDLFPSLADIQTPTNRQGLLCVSLPPLSRKWGCR